MRQQYKLVYIRRTAGIFLYFSILATYYAESVQVSVTTFTEPSNGGFDSPSLQQQHEIAASNIKCDIVAEQLGSNRLVHIML